MSIKQHNEVTPYLDKNGRRVYVGDFIEFLWWVTGSDGVQHEFYYTGRIIKRKSKLCFRYADRFIGSRGHFIERRLSALTFDSTCDWEVIDDGRRYGGMNAAAKKTMYGNGNND